MTLKDLLRESWKTHASRAAVDADRRLTYEELEQLSMSSGDETDSGHLVRFTQKGGSKIGISASGLIRMPIEDRNGDQEEEGQCVEPSESLPSA